MGFWKKIRKKIKQPLTFAQHEVASVDPTSSRSFVGRAVGKTGRDLIRQAAATSAVVVTGGAAIPIARAVQGREAADRLTQNAVAGFSTGAMVGAAAYAGPKALAALGAKTAASLGKDERTSTLTAATTPPVKDDSGTRAGTPLRRFLAFMFPAVR